MVNDHFPAPEQAPFGFVQPPMVYIREKPTWEYRQLVRNLAEEGAPTEDELNALGAEGWELAGVFAQETRVYFYFKRLAG